LKKIGFLIFLSDVQKRIMRSNSSSATGDGNHHHHHHRRLFIRNLLTDFRRQSSVNDYKFPNISVCTTFIFLKRFRKIPIIQHVYFIVNKLCSFEIKISNDIRIDKARVVFLKVYSYKIPLEISRLFFQ
jgi:hypothetical protein